MKKIYVFTVVCLLYTLFANAQTTRYWIGTPGVSGDWDNAANWSATSGGAPAADAPISGNYRVIFDRDALVRIDIDDISISTLTVTNSKTAKLYVSGAPRDSTILLVNSPDNANPALKIDAGSRLEDSVATNSNFIFTFALGAKGLINGTWYFSGSNLVTGDNGAGFLIPYDAVGTNHPRVDVNGTIIFKDFTGAPEGEEESLFFNSGSVFEQAGNGSSTPRAIWHTNSTIQITGNTTNATAINFGAIRELGNLIYNSPGQSTNMSWSLPNGITIKGNFQILNTNNFNLTVATNASPLVNNLNYTVLGNFDVSGTSKVILANASNANKIVTFQVNGNVNLSGTSFDLQSSNNVVSNPTTLKIKGNLNHTAGTFGASSNITSTTVDLFIVELNGTSNQNVTSAAGSIDNANNQVTLRMNNAAGATLLSPFAVGRISFSSTNKGVLSTTTTNVLTINNTGTGDLVVNSPGSTGYVSGPVRRRTASTDIHVFPTGKGGVYHAAEIVPVNASASLYQAEYFNTAYPDLSVINPLTGVSNAEYWIIQRISGAAAQVRLSLNGTAVPGAISGDAVTVAQYNGADWVSAKGLNGTQIFPGNATTGSTLTDEMATFNHPFTFGYGPAAALPIKLKSFTATKANNYNALNWEAICTSAKVIFEIQRSADGSNYTTINVIEADEARCRQPFDYADRTASTGVNYYRIRVIDVDGSAFYSRVAAIVNKTKGFEIVGVYPTLANNQLNVNITSANRNKADLFITNINGQVVYRTSVNVNAGESLINLNITQLASGVYHLTGINSEGQRKTLRFVKQ